MPRIPSTLPEGHDRAAAAGRALPGAAAYGHNPVIEPAECSEDEENGCIGGSILDDVRTVGHENAPCGSSRNVDVVVAGA